mgnify:CR=1 FL=1
MSEVTCEMPDANPPDAEMMDILKTLHTVAIVGLSNNPERDSHRVGAYLQEHGYRIVPVNPSVPEILGERSYPDLISIPFPVEIVDIFRKVEAIPAIVEEAILIGAKAIWMQLGLAHQVSAQKARAAGLRVVQSRCIKVVHARLNHNVPQT